MKGMTWGVWLLLTFFEVVATADYLFPAFSIAFARQGWQVHPEIALCLHLRYEFGFFVALCLHLRKKSRSQCK